MKKYLSILSLATVFILQSCDRSDLVSDSEEQIITAEKKPLERLSFGSDNTGKDGNQEASNLETGEDEEPRKDKSHWRISNDTVR